MTANIHPSYLRCEYLQNPLGIDAERPHLTWTVTSDQRDQVQTGFRLLAASSESLLLTGKADLWDSGPVSCTAQAVEYGGPSLAPHQRIYWCVQLTDGQGKSSDFSPAQWFEAGLRESRNWKGEWISGRQPAPASLRNPLIRKSFRISKPIASARLYATALGVYVGYVNGQRVSADHFRPGWTDYRKRVQYQTYDVTPLLRQGENALGFMLGEGWYSGYLGWDGKKDHWGNAPLLRAQLLVEYTDGTQATLATDNSWKNAPGPILASDFYMGETYDARREMLGWAGPGFDDNAWMTAQTRQPDPHPAIVAQIGQSVRATGELKPKTVMPGPGGSFIFDLGQNMVGWARLRVNGPAGSTVIIRFAEVLNPDGSLYVTNLRTAKCTDQYTLKGGGEEVYEPHFTFHGFRYVEISGFPGTPTLEAITGIVLNTDCPITGSFKCSNPMVNQLQSNIQWGQRSNFLEAPTDCPQRCERLGWMGDIQVFVRTACFNMDTVGFLNKWMWDVVDGQTENGAFADVSPRVIVTTEGSPAWGDAGVIVPWTVYLTSGDTGILHKHYTAMTKWIDYMLKDNPSLIRRNHLNNNYGEWLSIKADTPKDLLATAFFAYSTKLMTKVAGIVGHGADALRFGKLFEEIKAAFIAEYVSSDGKIKGETQAAYAMALHFGLLPTDLRAKAASHLVDDIKAKDGHLSTGFIGVSYLLPVLTEAGYLDVAYKLLQNDTFPSWGYSIKHGATTIWERWDGWTAEKGFQDPSMNSFNHYCFGSVGEWLYRYVAGIDIDPARPGYQHVLLSPRLGGGLTHAKARYESVRGPIECGWKLDGNTFNCTVEIPANTTATLRLPGTNPTESGKPIQVENGLHQIYAEKDHVVIELGSGRYEFMTILN